MTAYYNEIDPFAAAWLRELIKAGHIAPGDVDERSIEDVRPDELMGYTQCHFFAGIGVWSYALRNAGWPDDKPGWTGSCPCQPFSAAGKGEGFADERHLWPHFQWLIQQCAPSIVFGEQVASKDAEPWIDLVQADLEAMGYAFGCVPFPSAGVGAPHIRDRAYWVGHSEVSSQRPHDRQSRAISKSEVQNRGSGVSGVLADANIDGLQAWRKRPASSRHRNSTNSNGGALGLADDCGERLQKRECDKRIQPQTGCTQQRQAAELHGDFCGMGNANIEPAGRNSRAGDSEKAGSGLREVGDMLVSPSAADGPGPTNGFWRNADWLWCRDGKFRPVEPGAFPLADGAPARVGRLRGYGNAINAQAAQAFIESVMEVEF